MKAAEICDDRGVCIEVSEPAQRIIGLYGAFNEILLALGAEEKIVARTLADGDIAELAHLPEIGTHMRPNAELILSHKPDVVLQMVGRKEAQAHTEQLRSLGLKVLSFELNSFAQLYDVTRKLGQITGRERQAEELIASWQKRLKNLPKGTTRPTVYFEIRQPGLLGAGRGNIVNEIIGHAGGRNALDAGGKIARLNEEALLLAMPEVCLVQKGPMNPSPLLPSSRPNLKSLPCVQNEWEFIVEEKLFSRPGPRSVEAVEYLAKILGGGQ